MHDTARFRHRAARPLAVAAVCGAFALSACGSGEDGRAAPAPSAAAVSTTTAPGRCPAGPSSPAQNEDEKYLTATLTKLRFPVGTCLFMVDAVDRTAEPGRISVTVDLHVAESTSPNDLRPVATEIARRLKRSSLAARISVLDVTNAGAPKPKYRTLLTDENFRDHPWDGTPSEAAELAVWRIVEPG